MASRSNMNKTVTKTVRTIGPDGKVQTVTKTEEVKMKDGEATRTITTKTGSDDFGGFDRSFGEFKSDFGRMKLEDSKFPESGRFKFDDSKPITKTKDSSPKKEQKTPQSLDAYRKDSLEAQNKYRAKHGVPSLKLDKELNSTAQDWADQMAKSGKFGHRPNTRLGENIHYSVNQGKSAENAVDSWYSENTKYNYKNPKFGGGTGHFTQVVWKSSEKLGVGMAEGRQGEVYVVANYEPAGNMMGDYEKNVFPPKH